MNRGLAFLLVTLLAAVLGSFTGCGGDGNKRSDPSEFETGEYFASGALDRIDASTAYAKGARGDGVTVAIIGSGEVDLLHGDLIGQIAGAFKFDADGRLEESDGDRFFSRTGTAIAGLIAAKKNNVGIHGVAYNARIVNVDTFRESSQEILFGTITRKQFSRRVQLNTASVVGGFDAEVVYVSLPSTLTAGSVLRNALFRAADLLPERLFVTEAGDDGADHPRSLAQFASDPAMRGQMLVVGSVNDANEISNFSNRAGDTRDFYVVAPGEGLTSLAPTEPVVPVIPGCPECISALPRSTDFAAALVAGAAAALKDRFRSLSAAEIADILKVTATDLGDPGVDAIYGHGLINLARAMEPVGAPYIAMGDSVDGPSMELASTSLSLGSAFGDATLPTSLLDETIVLDAYRRPYRVALSEAVGVQGRELPLASLLDPSPRGLTMSPPNLGGASLWFELSKVRLPGRLVQGNTQDTAGIAATSFVAPLRKGTQLQIGWNISPAAYFGVTDTGGDGALLWQMHHATMPQFDLLGPGRGAALSQRLGTETELSAGWFEGEGTEPDGSADHRLRQVFVQRDFGEHLTLGLGVGYLKERNLFLGSQSSGAFGERTDGDSRFVSFLGSVDLGAKVMLEGSYSRVRTDVHGHHGLLTDWGTIESDAASLGLVRRDLLTTGDRAGVRISQPLRVVEANATLSVPVNRDDAGNVIRRSERVDLAPDGRELDLQLAYERPVSKHGKIATHLLVRDEPGHVEHADRDIVVGVTAYLWF